MTPEKIKKEIYKINPNIKVTFPDGCVRLEGEADSWEEIVACGQAAVDKTLFRGVINDIRLAGFTPPPMRVSAVSDKKYEGKKVDVLIIGGGIVGCAIFRELTKYDISVLLCEKEEDVATAQSARNDGMVHAGIDLKRESKKWHYNKRGNALYDKLAEELEEPFFRCGQYVLFTEKWHKLTKPFIKARAKKNEVPIKFYSKKELEKLEPSSKGHYGGVFCANAGVISPYNMAIAMAECGAQNGGEIALSTAVLGIEKKDGRIHSVQTNRGRIYPRAVINAAGVYSDTIAEMAGDRFFTIHPRKGVEMILDKKAAHLTRSVLGKFVISTRKDHTKGGGLVRTAHENILAGPNAKETPLKEDTTTGAEDIKEVMEKQGKVAKGLSYSDIITAFGGVRAATYEEDFIVEKSKKVPNFIQAAGIQSPGLTAAPAIAEDIAEFVKEVLGDVKTNPLFNPRRRGIPHVSKLSYKERDELIKKDPDFGVIVCRCEEVSKGEIIRAIRNPLGVCSLDGIKRRVRAGMGRCQGGFCGPLVTRLIAREKGLPITEVTKKGGESFIVARETK
ncbi:MAG: NAD(P)/FAD-dependent oxidoreductase [Christensenellales bacterium]|jgi:glycerol-3-phosphate dehydrogenase